MEVITSALEERGFSWAYRTVDTLAFGTAPEAQAHRHRGRPEVRPSDRTVRR